MKDAIRALACKHGFTACGFTRAEELTSEIPHVKEWLRKNYHANMHYMENHFEKRANPSLLVEGAKTVISVLMNYYPRNIQREDAPQIAKYAYGEDYHHVLKEKLFALLNDINETITPISGRAFTDSAPLLERTLAQRAGLGWIGRNSLLINPNAGSFCLLGELVVDLELDPDQPFERNYCGNCRKCIESCPTHAITSNSSIDSNKCLSYWTIEHRGEFTKNTPNLHNMAFGCDICQNVCPWNKKSTPHNEPRLNPHPDLLTKSKDEWKQLSIEEFRTIFKKSAVKRAKYDGLMRNIYSL